MRAHASWGSQQDVMLVFLNQDAYDRYRLSKEDFELLKEYQTWRAANITTVSQISDSTSLRTDNADIRIGIMTIADKLKRKPLAIGRPFVVEAQCPPEESKC